MLGNQVTQTENVASKVLTFTATQSQTAFTITGGYRINQIAIYRNGVRLVDGRDVLARDGATINLQVLLSHDIIYLKNYNYCYNHLPLSKS